MEYEVILGENTSHTPALRPPPIAGARRVHLLPSSTTRARRDRDVRLPLMRHRRRGRGLAADNLEYALTLFNCRARDGDPGRTLVVS